MRTRFEYIWLDGETPLPNVRSKTRFLDTDVRVNRYLSMPALPLFWNFDGGSTNQGDLEDSDRCLTPVRLYKDPFHKGGILAFCEVQYHSGYPHESNTRNSLNKELGNNEEGFLAGLEQEFTLLDEIGVPLGFKLKPREQGQYYCGRKICYN